MKKQLLIILTLASFLRAAHAQENNAPRLQPFSTYFNADKKFLVLPVKNGAPKRNVELWVEGVNTRFFDIELAEGRPDWFAYLDISEWKGKPVELRVDKLPDGSTVFAPVLQSDLDTNQQEYKEKYRPQFHFSPKRGWTNDPNGLVYYKGEYHLFFQHNPYGTGWGNMTWGHAVSKDLVHWKELGEALHPDPFGPMFSGGAVVDEKNTSGLGKPGNPAQVLFFTGAKAWAQCLAWSTDGHTFEKLDKAVVPRINKDNRDPKIIWHEPTQHWVMVVYVERDKEQHSMQFLTSTDLKNWTPTSSVNGGIGNDRYLFECPEFFELPVEGEPGEKKWILTGANSEYATGSFDGKTFTPEVERLNGQRGRGFYAAQTFSDEPKGRRIEIGWWQTNTAKEGMHFNQSQSIPLELKLVSTPEGPRLMRTPVKELESLRAKTHSFRNLKLKENGANPLAAVSTELAEIRTTIKPGKAKEITLTVRGVPVAYDVQKQELQVDGIKATAPLVKGELQLIIFADRTGLELFANGGLLFMPVNKNLDPGNKTFSIASRGGNAGISTMELHELKSIWE